MDSHQHFMSQLLQTIKVLIAMQCVRKKKLGDHISMLFLILMELNYAHTCIFTYIQTDIILLYIMHTRGKVSQGVTPVRVSKVQP